MTGYPSNAILYEFHEVEIYRKNDEDSSNAVLYEFHEVEIYRKNDDFFA